MKRANIYKGKLPWQSEFDHRWACWANNHRGWAKAKRSNKRIAKKRLRQDENVFSLAKELVSSNEFSGMSREEYLSYEEELRKYSTPTGLDIFEIMNEEEMNATKERP